MSDSMDTVRNQAESGWFHIDNELIDKYGCQLGAFGVAVYCVLCRYAKKDQRLNLSQREIAALIGISQASARKFLHLLAELGLIKIDVPEQPSPGPSGISSFTLLRIKATEHPMLSSESQLSTTHSVNDGTEHHTLSSGPELSTTCSPYKERKTKTKTKTKTETKTEKHSGTAVPLPDWLPVEQWEGYVEMRRKNGPFTDRAILLNLNKLEKLKQAGHDPGAVLDQSVERSWSGLFPIKPMNEGNPGSRPSLSERNHQARLEYEQKHPESA